ncbi:MAG: hypothetical protein ABI239_14360 [Aquihabitans sp.]
MICSASRYLMVAWVVGVVAASVTGSETLAWAAAAVAVALTYAVTRWGPQRFRATGCAVPSSAGATDRVHRRREPVAVETQ